LGSIVIATTPALAIYIHTVDGRYIHIPDRLIFVAFVAVGIVVLIAGILEAFPSAGSQPPPPEVTNLESAEYYDDQASRMRALSRKLDAETGLAKTYIQAERAKAELDELSEILGHDKATRDPKPRR